MRPPPLPLLEWPKVDVGASVCGARMVGVRTPGGIGFWGKPGRAGEYLYEGGDSRC